MYLLDKSALARIRTSEVIAKALRSPNTNLVANPHEIMESTALLQDFQQTTGAQIKPVDLNAQFEDIAVSL
jgi:NitT/TauT family transport system substrate-binding protein